MHCFIVLRIEKRFRKELRYSLLKSRGLFCATLCTLRLIFNAEGKRISRRALRYFLLKSGGFLCVALCTWWLIFLTQREKRFRKERKDALFTFRLL